MLVWTDYDLPEGVLLSGFQFPYPDGRTRTPMDRGTSKSRGSNRGRPTKVPCQLILTSDIRSRLEAFVGDADDGNAPFVIPDQRLNWAPMLDSNGDPLLDWSGEPLIMTSWWIVTFDTLPTEVALGAGLWQVSFQLEKH